MGRPPAQPETLTPKPNSSASALHLVLLRGGCLPPLPHHIITAAKLLRILSTTCRHCSTGSNPAAAPPLCHRCPFVSTAPQPPNATHRNPTSSPNSASPFAISYHQHSSATSRRCSSASTSLLLIRYFAAAPSPPLVLHLQPLPSGFLSTETLPLATIWKALGFHFTTSDDKLSRRAPTAVKICRKPTTSFKKHHQPGPK